MELMNMTILRDPVSFLQRKLDHIYSILCKQQNHKLLFSFLKKTENLYEKGYIIHDNP